MKLGNTTETKELQSYYYRSCVVFISQVLCFQKTLAGWLLLAW